MRGRELFAETLRRHERPERGVEVAATASAAAARQAIELRTNQLKGEHHLTDEQVGLYQATLDSVLPAGAEVAHDMIGTEVSQARADLVAKEGQIGEQIAELVIRAATSGDDAPLHLIGPTMMLQTEARSVSGPLRPNLSDWATAGIDRPTGGRQLHPVTGRAHLRPSNRCRCARARCGPGLRRAVARQEAGWTERRISGRGRRADATDARYTGTFGEGIRTDPDQNIRGGVQNPKWLSNRYAVTDLVAAGNNAGGNAVDKNGQQVPPYDETKDYVAKVARHRADFSRGWDG